MDNGHGTETSLWIYGGYDFRGWFYGDLTVICVFNKHECFNIIFLNFLISTLPQLNYLLDENDILEDLKALSKASNTKLTSGMKKGIYPLIF